MLSIFENNFEALIIKINTINEQTTEDDGF